MGEGADQIEQQINETRNQLSENFAELEQRVKNAFDWRTQFEERPVTMMAVAFGGGALLSALIPSRKPTRDRQYAGSRAADTRRGKGYTRTGTGRQSEAMDAFKGALFGVAANRLGGIVGDLIASYRCELQKVKQPGGTS